MKRTSQILQTGTCIPEQSNYIPSTTSNVLWGRLPCRNDRMIGTVHSGNEITIDTVSHEGLLEDQGSDPMAYFTTHGVAANDVLNDGIAIARECHHNPDTDGPHVVTGPIAVPKATQVVCWQSLRPRWRRASLRCDLHPPRAWSAGRIRGFRRSRSD